MFSVAPSVELGQIMCEYDLCPIFSYYCWQTLFTLRDFVLQSSSSNDASVDFADDKGPFEFSPIAEFTSPLYVHITIARDTEAVSSRLTQLLQC